MVQLAEPPLPVLLLPEQLQAQPLEPLPQVWAQRPPQLQSFAA
jgi:hypothetical protein